MNLGSIEASLSQNQEQPQPTAMDMLKQMIGTSKVELENSLLKEQLAESLDQYKKQSEALQELLVQMEEKQEEAIAQIQELLEEVKKGNSVLESETKKSIKDFTCTIEHVVSDQTRKVYEENIKDVEEHVEKLNKKCVSVHNEIEQAMKDIEEEEKAFLRFRGVKNVVFWSGCVCSIVIALLYVVVAIRG